MLGLGVIERVVGATDWVNHMVIVYKPNGDIRLCLDPRALNKSIVRERFQLPTRDEIFAGIQGATIFSKLDASQAFWQVRLEEGSRPLTTFVTPFEMYMYTRLPYGLCSAPEFFHKTMEQMFEDIEGVRVYMDDILIWAMSEEEHEGRLKMVKERIKKYNLYMNWDKCKLGRESVVFIGEELSKEGVRPSEDRIAAIMEMDRPVDRGGDPKSYGVNKLCGEVRAELGS